MDPDSICGTYIFVVDSIEEYDAMIPVLDSLYDNKDRKNEKRLLECLTRLFNEQQLVPPTQKTREAFRESYLESVLSVQTQMVKDIARLLEADRFRPNTYLAFVLPDGSEISITIRPCGDGHSKLFPGADLVEVAHTYDSTIPTQHLPLKDLKYRRLVVGTRIGQAYIYRPKVVKFLREWKGFKNPISEIEFDSTTFVNPGEGVSDDEPVFLRYQPTARDYKAFSKTLAEQATVPDTLLIYCNEEWEDDEDEDEKTKMLKAQTKMIQAKMLEDLTTILEEDRFVPQTEITIRFTTDEEVYIRIRHCPKDPNPIDPFPKGDVVEIFHFYNPNINWSERKKRELPLAELKYAKNYRFQQAEGYISRAKLIPILQLWNGFRDPLEEIELDVGDGPQIYRPTPADYKRFSDALAEQATVPDTLAIYCDEEEEDK